MNSNNTINTSISVNGYNTQNKVQLINKNDKVSGYNKVWLNDKLKYHQQLHEYNTKYKQEMNDNILNYFIHDNILAINL